MKKEGFGMRYKPGVILSNTCDIAIENTRLVPPNIIFAEVISLNGYLDSLRASNIGEDRIRSFLNDLNENRISNLLFLPGFSTSGEQVMDDSFIRLDMTTTIPVSHINDDKYSSQYSPKGDRLFSFSNYGFYLFLVKLSVHFCRIREGVFRDSEPA